MPKHRADRPPLTADPVDAAAAATTPDPATPLAAEPSVGAHRGSWDTLRDPDGGRPPTRRVLGPAALVSTVLVAAAAAAVVLLPQAPGSRSPAAARDILSSARPQARTAPLLGDGSQQGSRSVPADRRHVQAISRYVTRVGHVEAVKQATRRKVVARERRARAAAKAARERAARQAAARAEAARRARQWQLPVTPGAYHLTAGFGDCSGLWSHCHTGLDFAAPSGTPIHAVATGSITETGYDGAYGNKTVETLPDGTELWYCHQTAYTVRVGEQVTAGEVIGAVGSTGNTTGPHVHLEVRPSPDHPIDPFPALVSHGLHP